MFALQQNRVRIGISVTAIALVLVSAATAAQNCKNVGGRFTLQSVADASCTSPVGICAANEYSGNLHGTSFFVASGSVATADTPSTGVILLTGDNTIQTRDGTLLTKDAIVLHTSGAGEFAEVDTVVGGTGEWAGATGVFTATGTFGANGGEGAYSGQLCVP